MIDLEARLPAFALPFVLRSLRGGRGRRHAAISLALALSTVLVGLWLSRGAGTLEHELRVAAGFELPLAEREGLEFTVFAFDEGEHAMLVSSAERLAQSGRCPPEARHHRLRGPIAHGWRLLHAARHSKPASLPERALHARVTALHARCEGDYRPAPWKVPAVRLSNPRDVAAIEQVLAQDGVPKIERYRSPLDARATVRAIGTLALLVFAALTTVFGPLAVAMAHAQERRENTLTPLTGTTLSPRQLVLGLASGPLWVAAIYALPQLSMFAIALAVAGRVGPGLLLLVALAAMSVFVTLAAQVLAHKLGRRRTPGAIGVALLVVLSSAWALGLSLGSEYEWWSELGSLATLLPQLAIPELIRWTFDAVADTPWAIGWVLGVNVVTQLGAALLAVRILAQEVAGRSTTLTSWQAAIGAGLAALAVHSAFEPFPGDQAHLILYPGSALLLVPFGFLLANRVPGGDTPARLRRVPLALLMLEIMAWALAHGLITLSWADAAPGTLEPLGLTWVGWCFLTVGLLAIRLSVRAPGRLGSQLWAAFCGAFVLVALVEALTLLTEPARDSPTLLFELSPVLGLAELGLALWIPVSLVRHLRRSLGAIR